MKLTQPLISKRVGMTRVHNNMMVVLHLIVLHGEKVFICASSQEPPLPVEVRHPLARPDGAVVVGDGGAVTPQPPVRQIHRLHRVVVVKFQGPGEDGPDRHLGKL